VEFVVSLSSTDISSDVCGINTNGCCVPPNSPIKRNDKNNKLGETNQTKPELSLGVEHRAKFLDVMMKVFLKFYTTFYVAGNPCKTPLFKYE